MVQAWKESDLILALQALQTNPKLSISRAAIIYRVPCTTFRNRKYGKPSQRDIRPSNQKLTELEEQTLVRYILDLDSRSFPPRHRGVEDMANRLLRDRDASRVGKNWVSNFVRRQPELRIRFNCRIDYQRIQCKDPDKFREWFSLIQYIINKFGIQEGDIYNFDKTGFLMGQISSEMVITSTERRGKPRTTQQGNREWVTVIQGMGALGYTIPPYIIIAGKNHLSSWYQNSLLPHN